MSTAEWTIEKVEGCLARVAISSVAKLQTKDYRASGKYPVIDQGQAFIAGWTDDEAAVISEPLPLIVFGDHTRAFKFVDFPFVRGADGTQILKPKEGIDPLYFYYACRAIDLPSRGYNRHFTILKNNDIALAPGDEQREIARALRRLEDGIEVQNRQLEASQELKRAAMREVFTRGLRGEALKETEFGRVPESWSVEPIEAHFSVVSGGTPSREVPEFWVNGAIPWVKTTEVDYRVIPETEEHITAAGLYSSAAKLLPAGTLLLAMYGQGVTRGKVAILGIDAACNQACAAIRPSDDTIDPKYLYHFLVDRYEAIRNLAHGGQQQNLNLEIVRGVQLAFSADRDEQCEIVSILDAIDRKIDLHRQKRAVLDELFKALLHKLMTGEIRVADLDLSALNASSSVMPGLVPGIHVDGRVKPGHDDHGRAVPPAEAAQ